MGIHRGDAEVTQRAVPVRSLSGMLEVCGALNLSADITRMVQGGAITTLRFNTKGKETQKGPSVSRGPLHDLVCSCVEPPYSGDVGGIGRSLCAPCVSAVGGDLVSTP